MLTQKQEKFVQELIKGKSQREAYRAAYDCENSSDETIDAHACRLLKNDKVAARYDDLWEKVIEPQENEAIATAKEVLEELTAIGLGRKKFAITNGFGVDISSMPSISERRKALEVLAKHHGLLVDKVESRVDIEVNATLPKEAEDVIG